MAKKIIFSIFTSLIIAFSIFLGVMLIPEKNQEILGQLDYEKIQEEFFLKDFDENEKRSLLLVQVIHRR